MALRAAKLVAGGMIEPDELVKKVETLLKARGIAYQSIAHAPEGNCEKVSILRGNKLHEAAKALLVNLKISNKQSRYVLAVLPGDRKVDFAAIAAKFNPKSAGMAEKSKVEALMQCDVGRVPPVSFHEAVDVIVDKELVDDNEFIYFSPGRLDQSFKIKASDYRSLIKEEYIFSFSEKSVFQSQLTLSSPPLPSVEIKADVTVASEQKETPSSTL